MTGLRVALCHEWISQRFGSEKTFEAMAQAFPEADLYALTWDRASPLSFGGRVVTTTFIDRIRPLRGRRAWQLPLMPLAMRYATRSPYDLVVTSSHACAKGFWPGRSTLHLCYCYTPMRYVWLSSLDQRGGPGLHTRIVGARLRSWDLGSVGWVDEFAAISTAVQQRIGEVYGRKARVIHPPVDVDYFTPAPQGSAGQDFALAASRMVRYKRLDLVIRACHRLDFPLTVAGAGPEEARLRALADELGARTTFEISPPDARLRELYRSARVVVFPAEEDFGIVTVEAQACGTPVVVYGRGGSADTMLPGTTGVMVSEQDDAVLRDGIEKALAMSVDAGACRDWAEQFSAGRFRERFSSWVSDACAANGVDLEPLARR